MAWYMAWCMIGQQNHHTRDCRRLCGACTRFAYIWLCQVSAARAHDCSYHHITSHAYICIVCWYNSKDIIQRWTFPLVPDNNLLGHTSYQYSRRNVYKETKDVNFARYIHLSLSCRMPHATDLAAYATLQLIDHVWLVRTLWLVVVLQLVTTLESIIPLLVLTASLVAPIIYYHT